MDRILSARVDEATLRTLRQLAARRGTTQKAILNGAIAEYARKLEEEGADWLAASHGCWKRREAPEKTIAKGRQAFRRSMRRHRP